MRKLKDQYETRGHGVTRGVEVYKPGDTSHRLSKGRHKVTDESPHVNDFGQSSETPEERKHVAPVHPRKKHERGPEEDKGQESHKHRASFAERARLALAGPDGFNPSDQGDLRDLAASPAAPASPMSPDAKAQSQEMGGMGGGIAGADDSNVPQSPADMSGMGGAAKAGYRRTAADGPSTQNDTGGGAMPEAPPSMTGGPGSTAMPPMAPGAGANVPQTTPPAQSPGGGGGGEMAGAAAGAMPPMPPTTGMFSRMALEMNRSIENPDDPTGVGDEYLNKSLPNALNTRPRQPEEHRNVNTPQNPGRNAPIPTTTSQGAGEQQEDQR